MRDKIYIIGLPGAGKSYTGEQMAMALGWDFVDLDKMIEQVTCKTIKEVFEESGEEGFRKIEETVLKKTSGLSKTVISCGGGTPVWSNNMEWMQANGLTVYLNPEMEEIVSRLAQNPRKRPLIGGSDKGMIRKKLSELLDQRMSYYSRARVVWNKSLPEVGLYSTVNQLLAIL